MRDTSTTARAALYAAQTAEVFLHLLTIDHDDMPAPVRFVDNSEDVTSRSNLYTSFPFWPVLPADVAGELPQVDLVTDNVTRDLVTTIRSIATPATVTIEVILASDPDTVEAGPFYLEATSVSYNRQQVRMTLSGEALLTEPYPAGLFTPSLFPLLFRAVRA